MDGITQRHAMDWVLDTIASAGSSLKNTGDPMLHIINRGPAEQYAVLFNYKSIQVYDLIKRAKINVYNQSGGIEADFDYLSGFKTSAHDASIVDLHTPEDLSNNQGSTAESPTSGAPDTTKSWKSTSTITSGVGAITPSYQGTVSFGTGPYVGKQAGQRIRVAQSGTAAGNALLYYRFVATDEGGTAAPWNKFPTAGKWRRWTVIVRQETSGTVMATHVQPTIYNADSGQHHCAKFNFTGSILSTTAASTTGNVTATCEDIGNSFYKITIAHQSTKAEESQQCRVGFLFDVDAGYVTKDLLVTSVVLEDGEGVDAVGRYHKIQDQVRPITIQDYTLFTNTYRVTALSGTTSPAKSPAEEFYIWVKQSGNGAKYKVSLKAGNAKCKVGSAVYMAASSTAPNAAGGSSAFGPEECIGSSPGDWASMTPQNCECGGSNALQDYTKGVYVGPSGSPNTGALRIPIPNTDDVALDLAKKNDVSGYAYNSGNRLGDGSGGLTVNANGIGNHGLEYFLTQANALKPFDATTITWPNNGTNVVEVVGSMIRVASATAMDEVTVWDSFGGAGLRSIRNSVENINELPRYGPLKDGYRIRVKGNTESQTDDYFMKFTANQSGAFGNGVWSEGTDYSVPTTFDATTMPHQLIRKQDDALGTVTGTAYSIYFEYGPLKRVDTGASWDTRNVGNEELTPKPSFVGKAIKDIFLWQGRLGFLTDSTVVLSEYNVLFNFWRTTATQSVADDRIDLIPDRTHGHPFSHAVPIGNTLLLLDSQNATAIVAGNAGVRADAVRYKRFFAMESANTPRPVVLERSAFLASNIGFNSDVREIFLSEDGDSAYSLFPSEHAPNYIQGNLLQMAASSTSGIVAMLPKTNQRYVYILKLSGQVGQRTQEALWRYDVGANATVKGIGFINEELYMLVKRQYSIDIEKMKIISRLLDPSATWHCRLDRRVNDDTPRFSKLLSGSDTQITLPFKLDDNQTPVVCHRTTGEVYSVSSIAVVSGVSRLTVAATDLTSTPLWVGLAFNWRYVFTPPLITMASGRGSAAQTAAKTATNGVWITYENTHKFTVAPSSNGVAAGPSTFQAPSSFSDLIATSQPYLDSGTFFCGVRSSPEALSLELTGNDHRPMQITKAEFSTSAEQTGPKV